MHAEYQGKCGAAVARHRLCVMHTLPGRRTPAPATGNPTSAGPLSTSSVGGTATGPRWCEHALSRCTCFGGGEKRLEGVMRHAVASTVRACMQI